MALASNAFRGTGLIYPCATYESIFAFHPHRSFKLDAVVASLAKYLATTSRVLLLQFHHENQRLLSICFTQID